MFHTVNAGLAIASVFNVVGKCGKGQPRKMWEQVIQDDLKSWKKNQEDTMERVVWREAVESASKESNPFSKKKRR